MSIEHVSFILLLSDVKIRILLCLEGNQLELKIYITEKKTKIKLQTLKITIFKLIGDHNTKDVITYFMLHEEAWCKDARMSASIYSFTQWSTEVQSLSAFCQQVKWMLKIIPQSGDSSHLRRGNLETETQQVHCTSVFCIYTSARKLRCTFCKHKLIHTYLLNKVSGT